MKKLSLFITCIFLAACGLSGNGRDRRTADLEEPTPIPTTVSAARPTYTVERGPVIFTLDFSGRVVPVVAQDLTFSRGGTVGAVYVEAGDEVAAGDLIADLDRSALESELALAQNALSVAEDQLAASQQSVDRERQTAELQRDLVQLDLDYAVQQAGDNPTPEQQYQIERLTIQLALAQLAVDSLDSAVDPQLQADVDAAGQRVAELESLIDSAVLTAPFQGVVTALYVSPGRAVTAEDVVGVLVEPGEIEISTTIRENQLEQLAEGMAVEIRPAGGPGETLTGVIRRLPFPFGSGAQEEQDQTARIQFDNLSAALDDYETGDRVNLDIIVTEREDVLWLPPAAVRDFNGRKFVIVQTGDAELRVDVEIGIEGDGRVEILSGLEEGETVVGQ